MNHTSPDQSAGASQALIVHIESDFEPLLPKFMTNRKKEVVAMRDALAQQDFETIRKIAHGMKGAGGSYGFDCITTMAATMEQAAKSGAADPIRIELDALATYLEQVQVVFD
ncbi:MAG: Hpt domain-containing protein [Nitrospira sp.]|nr:MAG: Hpt domain-containing protein [Nitrospira sp.]